MELVLYGLAFLIGGVVSYIFFGGRAIGQFDAIVIPHLQMGKKVILAIEDEAYMFEMYENNTRIRISRATASIIEEGECELESLKLVDSDTDKPSSDPVSGG